MPIKVLLDTDIGSDIDDAICLTYLLAQPECELLGITTVTGQAQERARLASVVCKAADRSIPIWPGIEQPLLVAPQQVEAPHAVVLPTWPHDLNFPRGQAIEFARQTIRQHPGEVVLLAIGPLTNIALLFAIDPEIPQLLKGLVSMGGDFAPPRLASKTAEWNIRCDPHAAAMVYRARMGRQRSVGLNVTRRVFLTPGEVQDRFTSPRLRPVLDMARLWFKHTERLYFHDPLAAVTLFDAEVCHFVPGDVTVELDSAAGVGVTHWQPSLATARHEMADAVNPARFFEHFFSVIG